MTMIEKVARAIARARGMTVAALAAASDSDQFAADYAEREWREYENAARFAIEAMRDPAPAMLIAVEQAEDELGWTVSNEAMPAVDAWPLMIDAALKE